MNPKHSARAMGSDDLPATLNIQGRQYRLVRTYKHAFVSAVALYQTGADRVVLKCHRYAPVLGLPMAWAGRLMAAHEARVMQRLQDLPGVPALIARHGPTGLVHEYIPGKPLTRHSRVDDEFFPRLKSLLDSVHERGIAYVDMEKAGNILLGSDGRPYLIDFQIAFCWPKRFLGRTWPLRVVRRMLQRSDAYHLRKHWRRVRPDQLSKDQIVASKRKPWAVQLGNAIISPYKKLRRLLFGRR